MADELTERIIGAAMEVHRILGPGLLESIYEEALCYEFELRGIPYERQVPVETVFKGRAIKGLRIDLLVEKEAVVEIKSQNRLPDTALPQVISHLNAAKLKRGLIINFGLPRLIDGIKRVSVQFFLGHRGHRDHRGLSSRTRGYPPIGKHGRNR